MPEQTVAEWLLSTVTAYADKLTDIERGVIIASLIRGTTDRLAEHGYERPGQILDGVSGIVGESLSENEGEDLFQQREQLRADALARVAEPFATWFDQTATALTDRLQTANRATFLADISFLDPDDKPEHQSDDDGLEGFVRGMFIQFVVHGLVFKATNFLQGNE